MRPSELGLEYVVNMKAVGVSISLVLMLGLVGCGSSSSNAPELSSKQLLGDALFNDKQLSANGTQSCATCHDPENGFADSRDKDGVLGNAPYAASLGDDAHSLGDRNAPTAAYAALIPEFSKGTRSRQGEQSEHGIYSGYLGGQFWDGREANLAGQAGGPPTNPLEMGMADKAAVVDVLQENAQYIAAFEYHYGTDIFNDTEKAYAAMADAIAQFETLDTEKFAPFDSKYDKSLIFPAQYTYSGKAALGSSLFFSSDFSCAACHQSKSLPSREEPFTSFEYHNIGVPENSELNAERLSRGLTQDGDDTTDFGLFKNPNVLEEDKESSKGKFKAPTLRNIAITAPYMHNGVFNSLEAVLQFYEHAKLRAQKINNNAIVNDIENPETSSLFKDAEVSDNISHDILGSNDKDLSPENIEAIECFLLTLTDEQYEHLLDATKVSNCGI